MKYTFPAQITSAWWFHCNDDEFTGLVPNCPLYNMVPNHLWCQIVSFSLQCQIVPISLRCQIVHRAKLSAVPSCLFFHYSAKLSKVPNCHLYTLGAKLSCAKLFAVPNCKPKKIIWSSQGRSWLLFVQPVSCSIIRVSLQINYTKAALAMLLTNLGQILLW